MSTKVHCPQQVRVRILNTWTQQKTLMYFLLTRGDRTGGEEGRDNSTATLKLITKILKDYGAKLPIVLID